MRLRSRPLTASAKRVAAVARQRLGVAHRQRDVERRHRQPAEQRPGDVVLGDLAARLDSHALELGAHLFHGLLPGADRLEVEVVGRDPPLEERGEDEVVERLQQIDRVPFLMRVDPHDLVAEVLVLAADVRVGVVDVVVGVLPGLGRGGGVPVPGRGVDLGVVHPVPLPVQDVVPDLHVLEDLGRRVGDGSRDPGRPIARAEQQHPPHHREAAMHRDHARDVAAIAVAEVGVDLVVDGVELAPQLLDLLLAEVCERALDQPVAVRSVDGSVAVLIWVSLSSGVRVGGFRSRVVTALPRSGPQGR